MEFTNGTSLKEITDKDVLVCLKTATRTVSAVEKCHTFIRDGHLWVDLIPRVAGKYVMPLPDDAIIGRNDVDPTVERYGIILSPHTQQGQYVQALIDAKEARMQ
jgi:hypothetical protein